MTKGLVALVSSKAAITDAIGARFYPRKLPQGLSEFPSATYRVVDETGNPPLNGVSAFDFVPTDIQCYGRTYDEAGELFKLLRKELEKSKGTFSGVQIEDVVYIDSGAEDYLEELDLYTKQLELRIDYIRQLNP